MSAPTHVDPAVAPPGEEVLPGYRVEALLARGGRVDTYDVTDLARDCRAVVKVVRPDRAAEPHVSEALRTEGRLLTTLAHPHLVRGYELLDGVTPAVVLETVPGATLAAVLDDGRPAAVDVAVVGRQLGSVLGYLHRQGWLHLDVKPENVVVQEGRVVLIDLGLAARPGLLVRGVGTDGYAAPEQDAGGEVSTATDVWGLGATLFECLAGRAPGCDPEPVRGSLAPLVAACLAAAPRDRPPLTEVTAELDRLLADPRSLRSRSLRAPRRRQRRRP